MQGLSVTDTKTHQADETVGVECMLAGEHVELSRKQRLVTMRAPLSGVDRDEALLESRNVLLDGLRILGHIVHLRLQRINMRRISLQGIAYLLLEVVDDYEVGEEWQNVLNLEKICVLQEPHGPTERSDHAVNRAKESKCGGLLTS